MYPKTIFSKVDVFSVVIMNLVIILTIKDVAFTYQVFNQPYYSR